MKNRKHHERERERYLLVKISMGTKDWIREEGEEWRNEKDVE
jgi:hypothetical protein